MLNMMVAIMMGRKPSMRLTSSTCVTVYSHFSSAAPACFPLLRVAALSRHLWQEPQLVMFLNSQPAWPPCQGVFRQEMSLLRNHVGQLRAAELHEVHCRCR